MVDGGSWNGVTANLKMRSIPILSHFLHSQLFPFTVIFELLKYQTPKFNPLIWKLCKTNTNTKQTQTDVNIYPATHAYTHTHCSRTKFHPIHTEHLIHPTSQFGHERRTLLPQPLFTLSSLPWATGYSRFWVEWCHPLLIFYSVVLTFVWSSDN